MNPQPSDEGNHAISQAHPEKNTAYDEAPLDAVKGVHPDIIESARSASAKERSMTLKEGIRLYPKAIAWSIAISTCIAMEGYDVCLINNFCKCPCVLCRLGFWEAH